jgi:hypothetical protein
MRIDDVTQNFLYGSFQVEHSSGFVTPGDFKRSLVKYFELGHESDVRAGRRVEQKSTWERMELTLLWVWPFG